jgi:hypothetical protein
LPAWRCVEIPPNPATTITLDQTYGKFRWHAER